MAKYMKVETTVPQAGLVEVVVVEEHQFLQEFPRHSKIVEEEREELELEGAL